MGDLLRHKSIFAALMIAHLSNFRHNSAVRATGMVFAATGFLFGTWAALIPYVKTKFGLDEAQLGLLLLFLPAGVTLMNPFSVPILHRLGAVRATWVAHIFAALLFILPIAMPSVWLVALSLFMAGASYASLNIAMNTCASLLEQRSGLHIMATCHGFWSLGAMFGAASVSVATGWGVQPLIYVIGVGLLQLGLVVLVRKPLSAVPDDLPLSEEKDKKTKIFIWPNKALWVLIVLSLCINLTEGTMADWSAVYMQEVMLVSPGMAGWGFAVFAFFMAGGRLLGDSLLAKYRSRNLLRIGGVLACAGLLLAVSVSNLGGVLFGFACVGAGVALGAPILYAAAARVPGLPKGAGLATMNTFAMVGFLGGPAFIGFLAKAYSLPLAFGVVAIAAAIWVMEVRRMI